MIIQKSGTQDFQQSIEYAAFFGIDGELIEFEWNISQGCTSKDPGRSGSSTNTSGTA